MSCHICNNYISINYKIHDNNKIQLCKNCLAKIPSIADVNYELLTQEDYYEIVRIFKKPASFSAAHILPELNGVDLDHESGCIRLQPNNEPVYFRIIDVKDIILYITNIRFSRFRKISYCDIGISYVFDCNVKINYIIKRRVLCHEDGIKWKPPAELKYYKDIFEYFKNHQVQRYHELHDKDIHHTAPEIEYIKACALYMVEDISNYTFYELDNTLQRLLLIYKSPNQIKCIRKYYTILKKKLLEKAG